MLSVRRNLFASVLSPDAILVYAAHPCESSSIGKSTPHNLQITEHCMCIIFNNVNVLVLFLI